MKNPAREKFLPLLSPYVDGELSPEERLLVEQHLANSKESTGQVADFRAADGLMRHALEMQADTIDWKAFADDVMAKVTPAKLPVFERVKISLSEMFVYQRGPLMATRQPLMRQTTQQMAKKMPASRLLLPCQNGDARKSVSRAA